MDPQHSLDDTITADAYVWDFQKQVVDEGETGAQSQKFNIHLHAVALDLTVSATAILRKEHQLELETLVPASVDEGSTNAPEPLKISYNTPAKKTEYVEPIMVDSTALLACVLDDNAGKSVSVRPFRRKSYKTVKIVVHVDQISEVPHRFEDVQDKFK